MGNVLRDLQQYKVLRQASDRRFGMVTVWQRGNELILEKVLYFSYENEMQVRRSHYSLK